VYVAGQLQDMNRRTRWHRELPGPHPEAPADLPGWLDGLPLERAVLLPCSDEWALAVASLDDERRSRFPASVSSPETIGILVDKARSARTLTELGVPHPWSLLVDAPEDLDDVDPARLSNLFLKPRDSQTFMRDYGVKAFRLATAEEARRRIAEVTGRGHRIILQEYLPGPPSYHYFIDGFIDRNGAVRALFARQRLRMYPPSFGNSTFMRTVPVSEVQPAADSLVHLLGSLGYRGMFSAEFKLDPRDVRYKLLEVNARAWWYVEFAARCGVDVCEMAWLDAQELPVPEIGSYRLGQAMVYPYRDYFACRRQRREGRLSLWGWAASWVGALQPIFHPGDPWPSVAGASGILGGWLRRRVLRAVLGGSSSQG
jgi:predicted ATP-grasp superfamily ATP-dependent carboligase